MSRSSDRFFDIENEIVASDVASQIEVENKGRNIIAHLEAILLEKYDRNYYNNIGDKDRKTFSAAKIHHYLSLSPAFILIVNEIQKYDIPNEMLYKLYHHLLPKEKGHMDVIKARKQKKQKKDLIELLCKHYQVSQREARDYINIFYEKPEWTKRIVQIAKMYGKTEKQITKLLTK